MKTETLQAPKLNRQHDRCDRCGAQAFASVTLASAENPLFFCAHHFREHEDALKQVAVAIIDETDRVNEKPSISANAE